MTYADVKVGDQVYCINNQGFTNQLEYNKLYTITYITFADGKINTISFQEGAYTGQWFAWRFAVLTKRLDFTNILEPTWIEDVVPLVNEHEKT